ncbi:Rho termination factor N-terminal domain-containing protein [Streptomyces ficellus]|uniref:Rho termination factor N-terminal domain-containing protein n=1 Tax=Streptomyces ficellus TaxID=1977088 RepID=A0ABT7Z0F8_9ACTN|nr:Rho termination factor N-terminal domain-containing protein [Streptomyces ficellus]MDN3292982.1 Rho termination factor N-terminal domain-containing protein [Streptomyces ficellus]
MSLAEKLLDAYPAETGLPPKLLSQAADKLYECAGACLASADAAAAEQDPEKIAMSMKCVRIQNDCADLCTVAARVLIRQTGYDAPTSMAVIEATRTVLRASREACEELGDAKYCALSAKACRETEKLLDKVMQQMRSGGAAGGYPESPPSATTPPGATMSGKGTRSSKQSKQQSRQQSKQSGVSQEQLDQMHMDELRDLARERGITKVSSMRKRELVDAISGGR